MKWEVAVVDDVGTVVALIVVIGVATVGRAIGIAAAVAVVVVAGLGVALEDVVVGVADGVASADVVAWVCFVVQQHSYLKQRVAGDWSR